MTFELVNVSKTFGAVAAITDVSVRFEPGLIHAIIGPNGAGKSTLVNVAGGSYAVSAGRIVLDGRELQRLKKHQISLAGVARTYQNIRLFDHMSVMENLEVCLYPQGDTRILADVLGLGAARRRAARHAHCARLLERFDLLPYAAMPARSLPYGRQRLLEIARALVRAPRVLLLDEPAAGLNDAETRELRQWLLQLRRPDLVIIVIEHDMDLVMSISDHVTVMHRGRVLFAGTPAQVQENADVREAYLGTEDELDAIRSLAQRRKAERRLWQQAGAG
jgi:branched-chain amino acid transport system ATP-binding protein